VSIPNGPSALAVKEAAWGLARYAAISQVRKPLKLYKWFILIHTYYFNNFINALKKFRDPTLTATSKVFYVLATAVT